jgi:hypothetical protein
MHRLRSFDPGPGDGRQRGFGARAAAALALLATGASADVSTTLPHTLYAGAPRGSATVREVDPGRTRRAAELPRADAARVMWQRQIPGGVSSNVLVDDVGRAFVAGQGRISQLAADGSLQFSAAVDFSSAVSAALLADGTRGLLTREARVMGWSPAGSLVFDVALDAPAPSASSTLLPLPDGELLTSVGSWLFSVEVFGEQANRSPRFFASLPAAVQHTLLVEQHSLAVDERGRVFEWDRRGPLRLVGAFSGPASAILADGPALLAVVGRSVERMQHSNGDVRELTRFEPPGLAPLLALPAASQPVAVRPDGTWLSLQSGAAPNAPPRRSPSDLLTRIDLVVDSSGAVVWWAANVPLHVETALGVVRELSDVRCAVPASLVPAGPGRLIAACNSGAIWLIGLDSPLEPEATGKPANLPR